mgnify:CR=1 FL=1
MAVATPVVEGYARAVAERRLDLAGWDVTERVRLLLLLRLARPRPCAADIR